MAVSGYTCNTCGLAFETTDGQRFHMKSDWHRYNLKRRVAQLPSISLEVFNEKVTIMGNNNNTERDEEKDQKTKNRTVTKKELKRQKKEEITKQKLELLERVRVAILSQTTTDSKEVDIIEEKQSNEEKVEEKPTITEQEIEEQKKQSDSFTEEELADKLLSTKLENQVKIPSKTCLFCKNRTFSDVSTNVAHMFKNHGMFIPEQKFLVDLEGLLNYLGEKIGLGNVCLCCNYQGRNLQAVRAHMVSKGHCRLPYDTEDEKLEISEFYDFSSTYESSKKQAVVEEGEDGDWEDVSGDEDAEDEDQNEDLEQDVLYNDGVELYLPTGIKVGHRALQRYFKQDLKPERILLEGQGTVIAAETRHLVSVVDKKALEVQKRAWKTEVYNKKRDDKRAAKFINNQPHFRDPLLQ